MMILHWSKSSKTNVIIYFGHQSPVQIYEDINSLWRCMNAAMLQKQTSSKPRRCASIVTLAKLRLTYSLTWVVSRDASASKNATNKCNNCHMTEHTQVLRRPCFIQFIFSSENFVLSWVCQEKLGEKQEIQSYKVCSRGLMIIQLKFG